MEGESAQQLGMRIILPFIDDRKRHGSGLIPNHALIILKTRLKVRIKRKRRPPAFQASE